MFEEIPRQRRGLDYLTSRRIFLGHFALGGGLALAALGGSVAVAATVITASTIGLPDLLPSHSRHIATPIVPSPSHFAAHPAASTSATSARPAASSPTATRKPAHTTAAVPQGTFDGSVAPSQPTQAVPPPSSQPTSGAQPSTTSSATPRSSGPSGNAVIYFTGYDGATGALLFRYAHVDSGAGPGGSDVYSVTSPRVYRASLVADTSITSGRTLCPPAGSKCTASQLIAAAPAGLFAEVAIDPSGTLRSVIERDSGASASRSANLAPTSPTSSAPEQVPANRPQ